MNPDDIDFLKYDFAIALSYILSIISGAALGYLMRSFTDENSGN